MDERGQGRYDRSRYGSGSNRRESSGRYHDNFFDDMRISEEEPARSFSSRLQSERGSTHRSERGTEYRTEHRSNRRSERKSDTAGHSSYTSKHSSYTSEHSSDTGHSPHVTAGSQPHQRRDYSRRAVEANLAKPAKPTPKKPRDWRRVAIVAGAAVAVAVLVGVGVAAAYFSGIAGNLHEGVDDDLRAALVETDMAKEPFYLLLLGSDGSAERDRDPEYGGGYRSDSMMLARIDPVEKKAALVSISRDILIDLGGDVGEEKINAAFAVGGPAKAVEAVSKLAGVPISHYAQVDFDGFAAMVDALGGVEVDVPMSFHDEDAAGELQAGMQVLDGAHALVLCRMRNAYADIAAHPDAIRAANQRLVLSAIAHKLLDSDIATIAATVQAMSAYVTTDLELTDIIGLAQTMKGINSDTDIYTASVPTTSEMIDEGWYEIVNKTEWEEMMKRIDAGEPPVEEAIVDDVTGTVLATAGNGVNVSTDKQVVVTVKNATKTSGLASKVRTQLVDAGYTNVVVGEITDSFSYPETLVVYDAPGRAREAAEIVNIMGQGEALENDGSYLLMDTDLVVIIGEDWDVSQG